MIIFFDYTLQKAGCQEKNSARHSSIVFGIVLWYNHYYDKQHSKEKI